MGVKGSASSHWGEEGEDLGSSRALKHSQSKVEVIQLHCSSLENNE